MRLFTEETGPAKDTVIVLMLTQAEARDICDAVEEGIKHRPRKTRWKKTMKVLEMMGCY